MIPLAVHLSPRFRVYALDLPGHGRSAKPPAAPDVVELSGAVAAWMSANSVDSAMLVANSFGCQVVAELAVRHPARVLAAVLTGPTIDAGARRLSTQVARLALDLLCEPPSIILLEAASYARFGPRRLWLAFRHMVRDRIEDTLPDVRAPVVIARGARDPIVPRVWAAYLAARAPQATFVEIAGAAHAVHYSAARAVAEVVTALAGRTAAGDMQRPAMSPGG
jgi:pimeloyl-ACP methyl ester carboxylesterase